MWRGDRARAAWLQGAVIGVSRTRSFSAPREAAIWPRVVTEVKVDSARSDASAGPSTPRVDVDEAVRLLREGGVVALPTETVYGLGASALDPQAVARVFRVKGRPEHHPLIVHLASADLLPGWAVTDERARRLAERFWPGPLTIVLPRGPLALDAVTGGLETVGVRVPDHPLTLAVLARLGSGVAAPSANRFGRISPTRAEHVASDLGADIDGVLDGGPCLVGIESTIVDLTRARPAILRLGGITREALEAELGEVDVETKAAGQGDGERARAPGQLASHYAPRARLEVWPDLEVQAQAARKRAEGVDVCVLDAAVLGTAAVTWAARLYDALRVADAQGPDLILVATPPRGALSDAVADRLTRAAAPR